MSNGATHLAPVDLAVVALYLIAITVFGLRFSKRDKQGAAGQSGARTLKSYFLADNTIPWWAIALSIVSAETSTLTIVSIPGVAFAGNMGFLQVVLGYMVGRIVVALLFLPRYFRGEMLTAYQLIDQRFGPALHKLTAGLFLLLRAAAEGVRVFAISIVVSVAVGTGDTLSIAIISALTLLYTFEGGMAAVIWTDVVQMALYVAGTIVALITLGLHVPGGWSHIHAVAAPLGKFHWLDFSLNLTHAYTFWAGLIGGTFLTMASHGTDQLMVQRMLAARNLRESRLALLSSGVVIFGQFLLFLLIGIGLFVFYSAHPQIFKTSDHIFPTFIVQQMPHGVAGLLIAAILAAAMSNLSAALNSLASTTVIDFWVPWKNQTSNDATKSATTQVPDTSFIAPLAMSRSASPEMTDTTLISRAATVFWGLILFAIAVYSVHAGGKGHVVETGLSIASVAYGCLLGVFLLGTLTRAGSPYGATQTGAIIGMIVGLATNLALWQFPTGNIVFHPGSPGAFTVAMPHIAFTWYVLIGSAVTFSVGMVCSLFLPRRRRALAGAVVFLVALGYPVGAKAQLPYNFTPVSTLITDAIAVHKLPGAVVLIGHDGKVVFEQAYGERKLAGEPGLDGKPSPAEAMTTDTIFDMASLSKVLVTTTALLQLYEQHKIDLDAPVAKYLPEFAQNGKDKITIRELLTHYSGLPADISLKDDWGLKSPDKAEGIRRAMASVPYGPPGITFKYSDINFITLGALVEKLTGKELWKYALREIFTPLGMHDSSYRPFTKICAVPAVFSTSSKGDLPSLREIDEDPACGRLKGLNSIAPTAHDDQGTAATNPDFDHLLRGTVDDPTTRRMGGVAGHAGVFSTAEDASRFCSALLQKLLHDSGPFPLTQATLRLATQPEQPATAAADATIFLPDGTTTKGAAIRGFGWDINSPYSRPRGSIFPTIEPGQTYSPEHPPSFGHTGYTGTSLWLDPASDSYVILLANAIHPRGNPTISPLRGEAATAAAKALGLSNAEKQMVFPRQINVTSSDGYVPEPGAPSIAPSAMGGPSQPLSSHVLTGIDVLEQTSFAALNSIHHDPGQPVRLGLLTNQAGQDSQGRRSIDILAHAPGLALITIFTPEHGLLAKQDTEHLTSERDEATHIPVISLYGAHASDRHPKQADLRPLDAIVIDLQDAGVRFWTYEAVLLYTLEAAAKAHLPVVVLDRPNPVGGLATEGPLSDPGTESYVNPMPMPSRHGLTYGELARYFNQYAREVDREPTLLDARAAVIGTPLPDQAPSATQAGIHADLTVIPMQGWRRADFFAATGLPWIPPSPNLRTLAATILYPGVGLAEQTNISVGRGTPTPFENIGAMWLDSTQFATYLSARRIPGIVITPTMLAIADTPEHYPGHGQTIPGIHLQVTDPAHFDSPEFGIEVLAALHHLYPKDFQLDRAKALLANASTLRALQRGDDPREIAASWMASDRHFREQATPLLLYRQGE
jgi:SSS family transporter